MRIEPQVYEMVDKIADEEKVDKTKALKILVTTGWKEIRLEKALEQYRKGLFHWTRRLKLLMETN